MRLILMIVMFLGQGLWEPNVSKASVPNVNPFNRTGNVAKVSVLSVNPPNRLGVVISFLQDVSSSYESPPMTPEQIRTVANALAENGKGGCIGYELIGRRSTRHFVRLDLNPLPTLTDDKTLSEQVVIQQERAALQADNQKFIADFVARVRQLLRDHQKETATDLAGAFERSRIFLNEPQHRSMTRMLVINSDGISSTTVIYALPHNVKAYLIGWTATKRPTGESFESPQGFVQFIKANLNKL